MGLLSGIGSVATVAANVTKGVFSLGKGALSTVGKIGNSLIGKFALGALAVGVLTSDPTGKGDSLFSKLTSGFKSFIGGIGDTVSSKAKETALGAVAATTRVGEATNDVLDNLAHVETSGTGLRDAVVAGVPSTLSAIGQTSAPKPVSASHSEPVAEAPDVQPEIC